MPAKFRLKPIQILFVRLGHDRLHLLEMFASIESLTHAPTPDQRHRYLNLFGP